MKILVIGVSICIALHNSSGLMLNSERTFVAKVF